MSVTSNDKRNGTAEQLCPLGEATSKASSLAGAITLLGGLPGETGTNAIETVTEVIATSIADAAAEGRWTCTCTLRGALSDELDE